MALTPFQYLKQNIDQLNFACEKQYIEEYKRAFSNVLDRLDKYFVHNGLYKCGDYQSYVENMLKEGNFKFDVTDEPSKVGGAAFHQHYSDNKNRICVAPEYMGHGTTTEGTICHEFFHQLTLGNATLKYVQNGKYTEVQLPIYNGNIKQAGIKRVWAQDNANGHPEVVESLLAGDSLDGGFICEAFTELSKQKIYGQDECYFAYTPQTSMIKFVNSLVGTDLSMEDFLHGDLPSYVKIMGRKNFDKFNEACERFQKKYNQNATINYLDDENYKKAQDFVVDAILDKIAENPDRYNPKEFTRTMALIKHCTPIIGRNDLQVDDAVNNYVKDFATKQEMTKQETLALRKLVFKTIPKQAAHEQDKFQMPNKNISFKQTKTGFKIAFNDEFEFDLSTYIGATETKLAVRNKSGYDLEIFINNGTIKMRAKNKKGFDETIGIKVDSKTNPQKLLISDKSGQVFKLDFEKERQKRNEALKLNQNLLENAQCISNIQNILSNNSKVQSISRMTNGQNKDLLVVKTENGIKAYERKQNEIVETKAIGGGVSVPIYDSSLTDMEDIFGKATKTANQSEATFPNGINRTLPTRDIEDEQKAREEAETRLREIRRERQKETDRKLEEERNRQKITSEEQLKRQKQIEEERRRHEQEEIATQREFEETERLKRQQQEINENFEEETDEYGVPLRILREQEQQSRRNEEQYYERNR